MFGRLSESGREDLFAARTADSNPFPETDYGGCAIVLLTTQERLAV